MSSYVRSAATILLLLQLKILRQLVELQLSHGPEIKRVLDNAWGIVHNKHRKKEVPDPPPLDPSDPNSMESLQFAPIGQDNSRKRYWVVDGQCAARPHRPPVCACLCLSLQCADFLFGTASAVVVLAPQSEIRYSI